VPGKSESYSIHAGVSRSKNISRNNVLLSSLSVAMDKE